MPQTFRVTLWERFFDFIFGYDLFISYSRINWDEGTQSSWHGG